MVTAAMHSRVWWAAVLNTPASALCPKTADSVVRNRVHIQNFVDNVPLEYKDPLGKWAPVQECTMFTSDSTRYRLALSKPIEVDVVVYWGDASHTKYANRALPAGVRTSLIFPNADHPKARTLASMEAQIPGFKLLSITRMVVDRETHNVLEHKCSVGNFNN